MGVQQQYESSPLPSLRRDLQPVDGQEMPVGDFICFHRMSSTLTSHRRPLLRDVQRKQDQADASIRFAIRGLQRRAEMRFKPRP